MKRLSHAIASIAFVSVSHFCVFAQDQVIPQPLDNASTNPTAMATDSKGNVYVADTQHCAIHKFAPNGKQLEDVVNGLSDRFSMFDSIRSMAISKNDEVFFVGHIKGGSFDAVWAVRHDEHSASQLFCPWYGGGTPTILAVENNNAIYLTTPAGPTRTVLREYTIDGYVRSTVAEVDGKINGVAIDSKGVLYFTHSSRDGKSGRVVRATPEEGQADRFRIETVVGSGLVNPYGVAIDNTGQLYVTDNGRGTVERYGSIDGQLQSVLGGSVQNVKDVAVAGGNVYVIASERVLRYAPGCYNVDGRSFQPAAAKATCITVDKNTLYMGVDALGIIQRYKLSSGERLADAADGVSFGRPLSMAIEPNGSIYCSLVESSGFLELRPDGSGNRPYKVSLRLPNDSMYVERIYGVAADPDHVYGEKGNLYACVRDTQGMYFLRRYDSNNCGGSPRIINITELAKSASSLAVCGDSSIYYASENTGRVYVAQRKDRQSDEYQIRSVILRGEPAIHEITCITVDADGNIYVCDRVNGAVHKYSSQGALLSVLATGLKNPARIAVNGDGNIYVLTLGDNAVREIWKDWESFINS